MSNKRGFDSLEGFTDSQIADLIKSNDDLEQEQTKWIKEAEEEAQRKAKEKRPGRKALKLLTKAPLEIVNRTLFWFFIGSFLLSFLSVYSASPWWFFWYVISACACIFYTPNRKAIKELLDAWPNIRDLIKNRD